MNIHPHSLALSGREFSSKEFDQKEPYLTSNLFPLVNIWVTLTYDIFLTPLQNFGVLSKFEHGHVNCVVLGGVIPYMCHTGERVKNS